MTRSGDTGLSAFLPDPSRRFPTRLARGAASSPKRGPQRAAAAEAAGGESNLVARLPVAKSWEAADFTLRGVAAQVGSVSVRQWVLQAIYRYRFAIGGGFFYIDILIAEVASLCAVPPALVACWRKKNNAS